MKTTLGFTFLSVFDFQSRFLLIFQHVFNAFKCLGRSSTTGPVHNNQPFQCEQTRFRDTYQILWGVQSIR